MVSNHHPQFHRQPTHHRFLLLWFLEISWQCTMVRQWSSLTSFLPAPFRETNTQNATLAQTLVSSPKARPYPANGEACRPSEYGKAAISITFVTRIRRDRHGARRQAPVTEPKGHQVLEIVSMGVVAWECGELSSPGTNWTPAVSETLSNPQSVR